MFEVIRCTKAKVCIVRRMKDVNKHAPKELKAYTECIDSHGCEHTSSAEAISPPFAERTDLTSSSAGYATCLMVPVDTSMLFGHVHCPQCQHHGEWDVSEHANDRALHVCRNQFRKCREEQQAFEEALKAGRIAAR